MISIHLYINKLQLWHFSQSGTWKEVFVFKLFSFLPPEAAADGDNDQDDDKPSRHREPDGEP